ncbi:hypothetical protein VTN00DRAFT_6542 [Thermoascus crustaceus]|uniref:uncharacterized protein n=1 Tax=Thermoascus crustaceus TaxID=5088 RepID=UPI0037444F95
MEPHPGAADSQSAAQAQPLPKFSRYRSVRQAAAKRQQESPATVQAQSNPTVPPVAPPPPPLPSSPESQDVSAASKPQKETIARSMSRYRRVKPAATSHPPLPTLHDQTSAQDGIGRDEGYVNTQKGTGNSSSGTSREGSRNGSKHEQDAPRPRRLTDTSEEDDMAIKEKFRQEAMEMLTGGRERRHQTTHASTRGRTPRREDVGNARKGSDHDHPREHNGMDARYYAERYGNRLASPSSGESKRASWKERMGLLWSKEHDTGVKGAAESQDVAKDMPPARTIQPGGGGIVPGIDAPKSAVNAGERRVLVQCAESSINLPVTPTTKAQDLIYSAVNCLSEEIDPKKSVLLESFTQLGIERPLRRYEHVRDVMNSWDYDGQNSLIVVPFSNEAVLGELDVKSVPDDQPEEETFHIYHSQKPGKWDKRYITLRADGQVVLAKKLGQEPTNICHLSDFDIYSPTARQLEKKIKPPKKICFAVKSQQKSSMFLSTENFVHFFATNDKDLAANWYKAVQRWRSWYLVHVLGEGQKEREGTAQTSAQGQHTGDSSSETTAYELGSFKPLLDMSSLERDLPTSEQQSRPHTSADAKVSSKKMYAYKMSTRERAPPPTSFPKKLTVNTEDARESQSRSGPTVKGTSPGDIEEETFSPTGLLGRTYSQRQRAMREREERMANPYANDGLFSHGLLSNLSSPTSPPSNFQPFSNPSSRGNSRSNTMRSAHAPELSSSAPNRSTSVRQKTKPLVDLTPVYQEPPQHARKGRGVHLEPGVPLVEGATGPELPPGSIVAPSATTWRRPTNTVTSPGSDALPPGSAYGSAVPRGRSNTTGGHHHNPYRNINNMTSPISAGSPLTSPENPFAPNSLLGRSMSISQGGKHTGHGVATGNRNAGKPMLDLGPQNPFAEGSLLHDLEASRATG